MSTIKGKKTADSVSFHLEKITTEQFAMIYGPPGEDAEITIGAQVKFGFIPDVYSIVCGFNYQMEVEDKPFLIIEVACLFALKKSSWERLISDQKLLLTRGFAKHLGVITAGITRGVLHAKTEHTEFNEYPMPLINVEDLLPEDIHFDL